MANAALLSETQAGDNSLFRTALLRKLYRDMTVTRFHLTGTEYYDSFIRECRSIYDQTKKEFLKNHKIHLNERIMLITFWLFPWLFKFVFKLKGN